MKVGTSGIAGERLVVVTPTARIFPASTCGFSVVIEPKNIDTRPADQVGQHRAAAFVGDVRHMDAGHDPQHFRREVGRTAGAGGGIAHLPLRDFTQEMNSPTVFAGTEGWMTIRYGPPPTRPTGEKSFSESYGSFLRRLGIDREARGDDQQGVAVGSRVRHDFAADDHVRAGAVVHHEGLAEAIRELVGDDAAGNVVGTAGSERNHEPDRPCRVILVLRETR